MEASRIPRRTDMSLSDIVTYLQSDLKQSILDDVQPCLQVGKPRGGYFAVPRLVLSYVDYLGALYHGYAGERDRSRRRVFAKSAYAKAFLRDIFGRVDSHYAKHGDLLWEIYRNGTIHLYEPMALENQAAKIEWQVYKHPDRTVILPVPIGGGAVKNMPVTHLVPMPVLPNEWIQPISTVCLYEDLLAAIDVYTNAIQTDSAAECRFRETVNKLLQPERTSLNWP